MDDLNKNNENNENFEYDWDIGSDTEETVQNNADDSEPNEEVETETENEEVESDDEEVEMEDEPVEVEDSTPNEYENTELNIEDNAEQQPVAVKKMVKIQTPIIIAGCVLVAMIIAFLVYYFFFNSTVVGTWVIDTSSSTSDEADGTEETTEEDPDSLTYYTFEEDGTATIKVGTMTVVGTWNYTEDAETPSIDVAISYFFNGTYTFELSGNGITGRTLTLDTEDNTSTLDFVSKSLPSPSLTVSEDFEPNDEVTGKWVNEDYNLTYEFNDDGTCTINQMDTLIIDGTYAVEDDGTISITYLAQGETDTSVEYTVEDDDTLTISGLEYTRSTDTDSE